MLTVILNPASGSANGLDASRIKAMFAAEGANAVVVTVDQAENALRDAVSARGRAVVAAGGDGTVSSVAAVLAGSRVPLGVLPVGTLNHFAKDLKLPMNPAEAVKTIVAAHVTQVDVGYVNSRIFINNSSIGIYPSIVERREALRREKRNKWIALAIATAEVLNGKNELLVSVVANEQRVVTKTPFLFVGNNEYAVEGIHLGARAALSGGKLYAYLAPRLRTRDVPKLCLRALAGRARDHGEFALMAGEGFLVETPGRRTIPVAADGEVYPLSTPLHYRIEPKTLNVIVPAA